jgi:hypothetical protein
MGGGGGIRICIKVKSWIRIRIKVKTWSRIALSDPQTRVYPNQFHENAVKHGNFRSELPNFVAAEKVLRNKPRFDVRPKNP